MKMKNVFVLNASLILLLLAACGAKPTPAPIQPTQVSPATDIQYYLVTNKLLIPTTQEQTQAFALNVDGDPQQHLDNKFGDFFTLLASATQGVELQSTLDQAVSTGQLVSLHMVKANDPLNDQNVSWSIFQGQKTQSAPSFAGSDKFTLDSAVPINLPIVGSLTNGHFTGGPGTTQVQMVLLSQLVTVDLIGVRLEVDFSVQGCANGKLGGSVTVDEFRSNLLPAIATGFNQIIKVDQTAANTLLLVFDSDHDGIITIQELENNPLLTFAISPDLDLLDASGNFNPGQDNINDSYSIGLGFTCVPAMFTAPAD